MKIGVFCHMFYPELFEPLKTLLCNVPAPSDLFLSTPSAEKRNRLLDLFADWQGHVVVRVVENRGRDLAPKLVTFAPEHASYDLVLHAHTKGNHPGWREHIYDHVLGSPDLVEKIAYRFDRDRLVGMVGPVHFPRICQWTDWGPNLEFAKSVAARAGIKLVPDIIDFPSGSMFWARPAALRPLLGFGLRISDFPEEAGQQDGTIAHAIERLFYYAAHSAGFFCESVSVVGGRPIFFPALVRHWTPDSQRTHLLEVIAAQAARGISYGEAAGFSRSSAMSIKSR